MNRNNGKRVEASEPGGDAASMVVTRTEAIVEDQLDAAEQDALDEHEAVIERSLDTIFQVGSALRAIREQRLYRATHNTFEAYCGDRWSITKTHANRTIVAAAVARDLTPIGVTPKSLEHTKPLARLQPDQRRAAWQLAEESVEGRGLTSSDLEHAAAVVAPKPPPKARDGKVDPVSHAKRVKARERRERKLVEEQERQATEARLDWEQGIVAIASDFRTYRPSAKCEKVPDLETAIEEIKARGPSPGDVAFSEDLD